MKLSNENVRLIKTILVIVGIIIIATAVLFLVNENVQKNSIINNYPRKLPTHAKRWDGL